MLKKPAHYWVVLKGFESTTGALLKEIAEAAISLYNKREAPSSE